MRKSLRPRWPGLAETKGGGGAAGGGGTAADSSTSPPAFVIPVPSTEAELAGCSVELCIYEFDSYRPGKDHELLFSVNFARKDLMDIFSGGTGRMTGGGRRGRQSGGEGPAQEAQETQPKPEGEGEEGEVELNPEDSKTGTDKSA